MAKGPVLHPVFTAYRQHQAMLLPPSSDELIAMDHPVRVVNEVLEKIDIDRLLKKYKGGGAGSFHPRAVQKYWCMPISIRFTAAVK